MYDTDTFKIPAVIRSLTKVTAGRNPFTSHDLVQRFSISEAQSKANFHVLSSVEAVQH